MANARINLILYSREKLNQLAIKLGVIQPEKFKTKKTLVEHLSKTFSEEQITIALRPTFWEKYGVTIFRLSAAASLIGFMITIIKICTIKQSNSNVNLELLAKNEELMKIESKLKIQCILLEQELERCKGNNSPDINYAANSVLDQSSDILSKANAALVLGDVKKSIRLYEIEAKKGNPIAQLNLGALLSLTKNYEKAFYWTELLAKKGDPLAQCNLGQIYFRGI